MSKREASSTVTPPSAPSHDYSLRPRKSPAIVQRTAPKELRIANNAAPKGMTIGFDSESTSRPPPPKRLRRTTIHDELEYDSGSDPDYRPSPGERNRSSFSSDDEDDDDDFCIVTTTPEASLENLKGMETLKGKLMKKVIGPFVKSDRAALLKMKVPRGILFSGKPGTGKSKLAEAIATEVKKCGKNVSFFVETGACLSKYVGETERRIRDIFKKAKATAPSIIFLDEIDGIGRKRNCDGSSGNAMYTILTTLLTEINHLPRGKVLLVAATNCFQNLDPALIRKGRFDDVFTIPMPNHQARQDILRYYFQKMNFELNIADLEVLANETENFAGCDLEALVEDAHSNVVNRIFPSCSWMTAALDELEKTWKEARIQMEDDIRPALNLIRMGLEAKEE